MYSSTVYVHFYVVSALFVFHATLAVRIPTVFRHCVRTFLLLSSTFCMHFYVLHSMRAFHSSFLKEMESWRAGELESCRAVLLLYSTWQSKSDVFQHCLRTFILCLSTFCVSFNTCCAHSYCIPALCAYIPTTLEHFLHAFLCVSFNACIPFIIFKRNGDLTGSPCW